MVWLRLDRVYAKWRGHSVSLGTEIDLCNVSPVHVSPSPSTPPPTLFFGSPSFPLFKPCVRVHQEISPAVPMYFVFLFLLYFYSCHVPFAGVLKYGRKPELGQEAF